MPEQRPTPGEAIREMLAEHGWTQDDLARIIGRHRPEVTNLISGKRSITAEIAIALGAASSRPAEYWLALESARQLSFAQENPAQIRQRVRMYELAPVKDMQKRGWIRKTTNPDELEAELKRFFGISSLDVTPTLPVAMRKSAPQADITPPQRAWCWRARHLADKIRVRPFDHRKLESLRRRLRAIAAYAKEARLVPETLGEFGIRFVVVEPLPGSKIDGAAFWIDERSPVIAVSIRFDRIDAFWFTLMHEFAHIVHEDSLSLDVSLSGEERIPSMLKNDIERRADVFSADTLVPDRELDSFIRRVSPLYQKGKIVQFAHRIKMHPGIIVGQLNHRGEVGYGSNRDLMVKIRETVTNTALTDGWGHSIASDVV